MSQNFYFGVLDESPISAECPILVWTKHKAGKGASFNTYDDAKNYLETQTTEWHKNVDKKTEKPFAIYQLLDGKWLPVEYFARHHQLQAGKWVAAKKV
ncbi:MAG: hypothetical protein ABSF38_13275 [Verrucomicrobiota bacterium]|jgi:hypothetical protein